MSCAFDKEKLTGYFDGELENAEKGEVEKHISACSECLRELGEIKSAALLVKTLPRLRAPRSIAEGVGREVAPMGRVHPLERYRKSILWTFSAATAALLIGTVAFFAGRDERPTNDVASGPARSAAPVMGKIPSKADELGAGEARKNLHQEEGAERKLDELARRRDLQKQAETVEDGAKKDDKSAPPKPAPVAGFGQKKEQAGEAGKLKDAGKEAGDRALAQEPVAAAKPAARPSDAKGPGEGLAKKLTEERAAAAPSAPPPAPAKPEPKNDSLRELALPLKEAEKADKAGQRAEEQQNKQNSSGTSRFTVGCPQVAATRAKAREVLAKWGVDEANAAAAYAKTAGPEPVSVAVDLTPSQFAELKKQLEAQSGVRLLAGGPEDAWVAGGFRGANRPAAPGGVGGGAGKAAEDPKAPTTRGVTAAPNAPLAKGAAESKQPSQGGADEDRKNRLAAAENAQKAEKVEKVEQAEKSKDGKPSEALGARVQAQSQTETRQRFILYFVEVAPEK